MSSFMFLDRIKLICFYKHLNLIQTAADSLLTIFIKQRGKMKIKHTPTASTEFTI